MIFDLSQVPPVESRTDLSFSRAKEPRGFAWRRMVNFWSVKFQNREERATVSILWGLAGSLRKPQGGEIGRLQVHPHGHYITIVSLICTSQFRAWSQRGLTSWPSWPLSSVTCLLPTNQVTSFHPSFLLCKVEITAEVVLKSYVD